MHDKNPTMGCEQQIVRPNGKVAFQLAGADVMLAEDELLLLLELESILRDAGAAEVHLCRNVKDALACAESHKLTVAILDMRLGQESVTPVAHMLAKSCTPFLFYTGQRKSDPMFAEWRTRKIVSKPASSKVIIQILADLIQQRRQDCLARGLVAFGQS
jgi:DNA-binding NtrC family response regulator